MILPITYSAAVLLLLLTAVCWGTWANTLKLGKWRYELFYYDMAWGAALLCVAAAFTLGSLNAHELTFQDNLLLTGYRKMVIAFGAGLVLNLANVLLTAALSVSGLSVALPIAFGTSLSLGVAFEFARNPQGSALLLLGGALLVIIAVIADAFAYASYHDSQRFLAKEPSPPPAKNAPRDRVAGPGVGIFLSLVSGILLMVFFRMATNVADGDNGMSPYGMALFCGAGVFVSTALYNVFLTTFPVQGQPVHVVGYLTGTKSQHALGVLGGVAWMAGTIAYFAASAAPPGAHVSAAMNTSLVHLAALPGALWGLLAWSEFDGAPSRIKLILGGVLLLFLLGAGLISLGPLYPN